MTAGGTLAPSGGSSVVRSPASGDSLVVTIAGPSTSAAALSAEKTVISKRPPEAVLPLLSTPQSLGQALIGKTLDHYELVEFVGGGGMGAVFRSLDTRLGRTVAVKVLSRDHTDEETIKRFRNEAQSAARLDHPNIARVYFVGEAEGWNFIVFEYIEGTNLRDIVDSRGPLPVEEALNYTLQVTEALDHASRRDVVHRDIKPSNVLVTPSGEVKLVDMGLARLHQVESSSEDLTASGVMLGTFDYISPEQARDPRSADVRSDIYSLGCTLYFMLAGQPPFPEGTAVQKLLKHNSEEPPDLRIFRPELPQPVAALVSRMLAKRPAQRHQSPQELIADVHVLAQQLGLSGLSRQANVVVRAAPSAHSFWTQALTIAGPIAALALVLWMIDRISQIGERPLNVTQAPKLLPEIPSPDDSRDVSAMEGDSQSPKNGGQKESGSLPDAEGTSKIAPAAASNGNDGANSPTASAANDTGKSKAPDGVSPEPGGERIQADLSQTPVSGESDVRVSAAEALHGRLRAEDDPVASVASASASSVKPKEIKRIIVRPLGGGEAVDDAKIVSSLAQACQEAHDRGVSEIELRFSGPLVEKPFDLTLARVRIFAGDDPSHPGQRFRPVIVFRPQQSDSERQMIRLAGGTNSQISLDGLELRLELPADPSSGWALLALYRLQLLKLTDCVLTVKGSPGSFGTAMLALQPRVMADAMKMMDDANAMLPAMSVQLTQCVARGEATFLVAQDESPLKVFWVQGLLVTPQRLLETGGTSMMKPSGLDKLEIELNHVTAIVPQGLVRQSRQQGALAQLKLEVRCQNSLLVTDAASPLFEFENLASEDEIKLDFEGDRNRYPRRNGWFLRLLASPGSPSPREFDLNNMDRWGRERGSDPGIFWAAEPPSLADVPAHQHAPAMYLLDTTKIISTGNDDDQQGFIPRLMPAAFEASRSTTTEADFFD